MRFFYRKFDPSFAHNPQGFVYYQDFFTKGAWYFIDFYGETK